MKTKWKFILTTLIVFFSAHSLTAAQVTADLTSFRAIFTWRVAPEIKREVVNFQLKVDNNLIFEGIPNQESENVAYSLIIDNSANQYQLIFEKGFTSGEHTWQIFGYRQDNSLVFQTIPEKFNVTKSKVNLDENTRNQLGIFIQNLWKQFASLVISVLSGVFLVIFLFVLAIDLIVAKATNKIGIKQDRFKKQAGFVFNSKTNEGIPFALITIKGTGSLGQKIQETSVSDVNGIYDNVIVPKGTYQLNVQRQGFTFPTRKSRPQLILMDDFYKGESIEIASDLQTVKPMIPLDPIVRDLNHRKYYDWRTAFWRFWQNIKRKQIYLEVFLFLIALLELFIKPTWLFIIAAVFYGVLIIRRLLSLVKPNLLKGMVISENGVALAEVLVEAHGTGKQENFVAAEITAKDGRFSFKIDPGTYKLNVKRTGYMIKNQERAIDEEQEVTVGTKPVFELIKLKLIPMIDESFFFKQDETDEL